MKHLLLLSLVLSFNCYSNDKFDHLANVWIEQNAVPNEIRSEVKAAIKNEMLANWSKNCSQIIKDLSVKNKHHLRVTGKSLPHCPNFKYPPIGPKTIMRETFIFYSAWLATRFLDDMHDRWNDKLVEIEQNRERMRRASEGRNEPGRPDFRDPAPCPAYCHGGR